MSHLGSHSYEGQGLDPGWSPRSTGPPAGLDCLLASGHAVLSASARGTGPEAQGEAGQGLNARCQEADGTWRLNWDSVAVLCASTTGRLVSLFLEEGRMLGFEDERKS